MAEGAALRYISSITLSAWAIWAESKSPTTALLTERGTLLFEAGDVDRALTLFRTVTALTPDFAEAWHRMAVLESERGTFTVRAVQRMENGRNAHIEAIVQMVETSTVDLQS